MADMNNATNDGRDLTREQIRTLRNAEDLSRQAKSPATHHAAYLAWINLSADATFSEDDRDAFARRAAEHYDRA